MLKVKIQNIMETVRCFNKKWWRFSAAVEVATEAAAKDASLSEVPVASVTATEAASGAEAALAASAPINVRSSLAPNRRKSTRPSATCGDCGSSSKRLFDLRRPLPEEKKTTSEERKPERFGGE